MGSEKPLFPDPGLRLIVAITGASGSLYAFHLIRALLEHVPGESVLIVSPPGLQVFNHELRRELSDEGQTAAKDDRALLSFCATGIASPVHRFELRDHRDLAARPASGSASFDGMVVVPCSMKTLSGIAHGASTNLIERAADVTLKERRRLIVVPRESPCSLIHLRNMTALTEAGGIVLPASPGFYHHPRTIDDLGHFIAGRILALFGVSQNLFPVWDEQ